ncbi:hypothetical protein E8E13_004684 [Curvularia kusanoi]|uniref:GPI-anchored cell surface glycoprotein n=1 Tax=Curvularia kusanoi TaxID=90978 RepID=A0A9P4T8A9_CURKU|nr:hypothetical protein E8E13_004684 [Curvularia kusanoi]
MSLNGLDDIAVTQAYQSALAEAGGWFLLKYTARDAVDVLTTGTGGANEARAAVAQYEDKSPLYGLLLYRRRKVLVKYIPEGTSRLLQARVAVHFITVTEKFAPHDIVLSIATPEELSDAALTSACTLHTAAPSSSSSSSSSARHQKLSWIREESEAPGHPAGDNPPALQRPPTSSSTIPTILEPISSSDEDPLRSGSVVSQTTEQVPVVLDEEPVQVKPAADAKPVPEISHVTIETVTQGPRTPEAEDLSDFRETLTSYDKLFEGGPEPRASSQTARPDYNELYEHYYAQYTKPKEKLGPRPRASLEGRRPSTSGSGSQPVSKAKSSLPSGLRSSNRKANEKKTPKLKDPASAPNLGTPAALPLPPPSPIPETPISPISVTFSLKSPASVRSMPVSTSSGYRSNGNSKERARLMKALELRKKQMKAQQDRQSKLAEVAIESEETKEQNAEAESTTLLDKRTTMTEAPNVESDASAEDASATAPLPAHNADEAVTTGNEGDIEDRKISLEEETAPLAVDSSGLVYTSNQPENEDLNSAASVSSPVSAQTQGSSVAPSTRPSSLSEDDHNNMDDSQKAAHIPEHTTWDTLDEQHSVDSSPTVVPESKTPVPSLDMQIPSQLPTPPADAPLDSNETQTSKRESTTTLMPSNNQGQSRRSNRESTVYMAPEEYTPQNDHPNRRNRESMILPSTKRESWYQTKEKRRALLDPIQVSAENSEAEYLSDDSFMEELRSAEVRQANAMSVSKSPIMPFFPQKPTEPKLSSPPKRAASTSLNKTTRTSPEQLARKSSGPWITSTRSEDIGPPAKMNSVKVSGGIAQRIKALAEKSKRDSQASLSPLDPPRSRPGSSLAQRKSNFFAASEIERSPGGTPTQRLGSPSYLSLSSQTTLDKKPVLEPSPMPAERAVYNVQEVEQPETVQVTARIIQDDRTKQPTLAMPTEATPLDLHQSPLIIDHQKPTFVAQSPTRVKTAPAATMEPTSPRVPSRDQASTLPRSSSESSWRSFGRRMSETKSIHSPSIHSPNGEDEKHDDKKGKKDSRTTKLFKRMSSGLGLKGSQSNLGSPEQGVQSTSLSSLREPPPPVQVGELNIQFPDTLLWKRRFAEIDATGNLILGPSISNPRGITKRFHLTDFKAPYPPDQDQQELPFSVVLDFTDGRTLQCACESSTSQAHVLQILREAHDAWIAHGQTA